MPILSFIHLCKVQIHLFPKNHETFAYAISQADAVPMALSSFTTSLHFHLGGAAQFTATTCEIKSRCCSLANDPGSDINGLDGQCVLWNEQCEGNKTAAVEDFFLAKNNLLLQLERNECFRQSASQNSKCSSNSPQARLSDFENIKSWVKSPGCSSALDLVGVPKVHQHMRGYCCGSCLPDAGIVELFYWPSAEADTACLSIVGNDSLPVDYGATTRTYIDFHNMTRSDVHWACTTGMNGTSKLMTLS